MNPLTIFVLTTAIGISASRGPSGQTQDALRALGKATYIQTGTDKVVDMVQKKYTPNFVKEYEKYGAWIAGIVKITTEQRVSLEWKF